MVLFSAIIQNEVLPKCT